MVNPMFYNGYGHAGYGYINKITTEMVISVTQTVSEPEMCGLRTGHLADADPHIFLGSTN